MVSFDSFPRNMIRGSSDRGGPRVKTNALNLAREFATEARSEVVSRTSRASLLGRPAITLRLNGVDFNPLHLTVIRRYQLADSFCPSYFGPPGRLSRARDRRETRTFSLPLSLSSSLLHGWETLLTVLPGVTSNDSLASIYRPSTLPLLRVSSQVQPSFDLRRSWLPRNPPLRGTSYHVSLGGLFLFETTRGGFCSRRVTSRLRWDISDENSSIACIDGRGVILFSLNIILEYLWYMYISYIQWIVV